MRERRAIEESATSPAIRIRSFRDLEVWQKAMDLAVDLHQLASELPAGERFELARDLRRTARSIPSNVAEGFSRRSRATYRLHVAIALGSQAELDTQLELASRLGYLDDARAESIERTVSAVGRMLYGLWRALGSDPPDG
jgi:four helix bundle protein